MARRLNRHTISLVAIGLLTALAAALLTASRTDHEVDLGTVVEIWGDVLRDVDRFGLTLTRVSTEREVEVGREIETMIARRQRLGPLVSNPKLLAYVTGVGEALAQYAQREGIEYRFHILGTDNVNAYAISGGVVLVTRGMLDLLESEAELAAILGHEISHVDFNHCIENLQYELIARKVVGHDLAAIASLGYSLIRVGFSEQQELEADAGGMILAAKAGYDPQAAIGAFRKPRHIEEISSDGGVVQRAIAQYFATHPPATLRIRHLTEVYERNASAWESREFYVGRSNYRERVGRASEERETGRLTLVAPAEPEAPAEEPAVGVYPETFKDCDVCPEMVVIPPGEFVMGSPEDEEGRDEDEGPQHTVRIERTFALGKYEVTFAEWDACVADGGCGGYRPKDRGWGRGDRPVIQVSWNDAKAYLGWLSRKTGMKYRLPSESEWEYAARAGTTTLYYWGDEIGRGNANCDRGGCGDYYSRTAPAGRFAANAFGVHDMLGNVWEWAEDCSNETYEGAPTDGSARRSGECDLRVFRGGSWMFTPRFVRAAYRTWGAAEGRAPHVGFRVARTLDRRSVHHPARLNP